MVLTESDFRNNQPCEVQQRFQLALQSEYQQARFRYVSQELLFTYNGQLIVIQKLQCKHIYISHSLNFRLYQFGLLYRNCKFTRMIISFRYTYMYVRRTSAAKATNDSGTSIQGRNAAASCTPIYTGIHLRRTICVSKEAMERLPLSNPEGSLMACPQPYRSLTAAQHFEPGFYLPQPILRAASQEVGYGEEREARSNEPIIDHTKQSWYFSNASSAQRRTPSLIAIQ
ncbi:Hypothetical_protein [Hexamita inflata]|uniref:Hypothetical_protein n=1 Tax=Hexamita inflata TaxID=28002 RepID=A0AA86PK17_9EUKA|nr:Hypothetical protein HINF_LOCUS24339 [Hexamita inflata]CAI9952505.1 Hypothetical protein HINF_LOCUS40150 [Hexamita inflata]